MADYVVNMLRALRAYLWTCLVERPGPLWWGVAIAAGLITFMLCTLYTRRTGFGRGIALPAGLLAGYAVLVVIVTVLSRDVGGDHWKGFLAGGGVASMLRVGDVGPDAMANALMLLPMGALLPAVTGWRLPRVALSCLGFSVWIETVQYICAVGYPDPFDIVLNVLGAVVGYGVRILALTLRARGRSADCLTQPHC